MPNLYNPINQYDESRILDIRDREHDKILKIKNVTGCGIGLKKSKGLYTNELCIIVIVNKKEDVSPQDRIPPKIDDIKTDVIEIFNVKALAQTDKIRPASYGYSIGHPSITAGTFGCMASAGPNRLILSNNHVIAASNGAKLGDKTLQPGPLDGGTSDDVIAYLYKFIPIQNGCKVDAAVSVIKSDNFVSGAGPSGWSDPNLGIAMTFSGRTSGKSSTGTIVSIHSSQTVSYGPLGDITLYDQFMTDDGRVTLNLGLYPGDSGSILTIGTTAVGLGFAGGYGYVNEGLPGIFLHHFSIANYMSNVCSLLNIQIGDISKYQGKANKESINPEKK